MSWSRGAWILGRYRGAPVRLHWTVVLGALFFGGFRWAPGGWLAFALVILVHELGHAVLVARYRHRVMAIDVHGLGGECSYQGEVTDWQRSVIAWGGVLAQSGLLVGAAALRLLGAWPAAPLFHDLLAWFLWPNALNMAFNLAPVAPLDGSRAWKLISLWRARRRRRRQSRAAAAVRREARAANMTVDLSDQTKSHLSDVLERARRGPRSS